MLQEVTAEIEKTAKAVVNEIHTALPTITEAPVIFPFCQSSGVGIAFPVKKGDSCIILVSEVELDAWRTGSDSLGSLKFDLSSAMVIPGLLEKSYEPMIRASSGNAVITGAIKAGSVSLKNHTHVDSTGGDTQKPK